MHEAPYQARERREFIGRRVYAAIVGTISWETSDTLEC